MRYRRGVVLEPLRRHRAIQERAERFISDRIARGVRAESLNRLLDIASQASRLDEEIRFLQLARQVLNTLGSRPLYSYPELPLGGMTMREQALQEEIHRGKQAFSSYYSLASNLILTSPRK